MLFTPSRAVSSEVGVFSSPNGKTNWKYHGIVVARGQPGGWDAGGVASPGAAVGVDGTVLVCYAAESQANGGTARAIGLATASHPLGPFTKHDATPVASLAGKQATSAGLVNAPLIHQLVANTECASYAPPGSTGHNCTDPRGCQSMCDDVILQSRPGGEIHVYYSTKTYQVCVEFWLKRGHLTSHRGL